MEELFRIKDFQLLCIYVFPDLLGTRMVVACDFYEKMPKCFTKLIGQWTVPTQLGPAEGI
jgi:hypothetical protein